MATSIADVAELMPQTIEPIPKPTIATDVRSANVSPLMPSIRSFSGSARKRQNSVVRKSRPCESEQPAWQAALYDGSLWRSSGAAALMQCKAYRSRPSQHTAGSDA